VWPFLYLFRPRLVTLLPLPLAQPDLPIKVAVPQPVGAHHQQQHIWRPVALPGLQGEAVQGSAAHAGNHPQQ
jgi:hypothetical protein